MKTEYQKIKNSILKYHRSKDGLIARIYSNERQRCRDQNKPMPKYNLEQLREWCKGQAKFHRLYSVWVKSNFNKEKTPSIDKINPLGNYTFDNIQLMTWLENHEKGRRERNLTQGKRIIQLTPKGKEIKKFVSITDAFKETGIDFRQISNVLCGRAKTAHGYKFEYIKT